MYVEGVLLSVMNAPVGFHDSVLVVSRAQEAFGEEAVQPIAAASPGRWVLGDTEVEVHDAGLEPFVFNSR
jgi:hypothetical protein